MKEDSPRRPSLVIIDEDPTDVLARVSHVKIEDLMEQRYGGELRQLQLRFGEILDDLSIDSLTRAGFTEETCTSLIKAEEARRPVPTLSPDMDAAQTANALEGFDPNFYHYASVWRRVRDSLRDGILRLRKSGKDVVLMWRKEAERVPNNVPVVIMSGTAKREIIEKLLPVNHHVEIDVAPHPDCKIVQANLSGAKSECLYGATLARRERGETDKKEIKAAEEVRDLLLKIFKQYEVVITYKELIEIMGLKDALDVETANFKAIEGLNAFIGKSLCVYGRPLPLPSVIEDKAQAIFGDVNRIKQVWYPAREVAYRDHGSAMANYHPDERAELVRSTICEGELMQAIGRARYVRNPAKIAILNKLPLPVKIDRLVRIEELDPEVRKIRESRVIPLGKGSLVKRFPALKDTRTAARVVKKMAVDLLDEGWFVVEQRPPGGKKYMTVLVRSLADIEYDDWRLCNGVSKSGRDLSHENEKAFELLDVLQWEPLMTPEERLEFLFATVDLPQTGAVRTARSVVKRGLGRQDKAVSHLRLGDIIPKRQGQPRQVWREELWREAHRVTKV